MENDRLYVDGKIYIFIIFQNLENVYWVLVMFLILISFLKSILPLKPSFSCGIGNNIISISILANGCTKPFWNGE